MLLIYEGVLIGDEEIKRIAQTKEGAQKINAIRLSTRVAFAADHLMGFIAHELKALGRELSYQEREDICNILHACLFQIPQNKVDEYVQDCYNHLKEHGFQFPAAVGHA